MATSAPFDFSGGALCLDFANTLGDVRRPEVDTLRSFADLARWAREAGIVDERAASRLRRAGVRDPQGEAAAFARAIELRATLFRLFRAIADGDPAPAADVARVNADLPAALAHLRVRPADDGFAWSWEDDPRPDRVLWPVLRSAAELLTSPDLRDVRVCASDRCTWLFVDRSRTRRRRWCDMRTCGNRAKARRHYERRRRTQA